MCNLPTAPLDPNLQAPREKAIDMHSNKFVNKIIITKSGVCRPKGVMQHFTLYTQKAFINRKTCHFRYLKVASY